MFTQRLVSRSLLAVTVVSLSIPLMMGQGCPSWGPGLLSPDPGTGQDTTPGDGASGTLRVDAGPDRAATVGAPIVLCASVEGGEGPYAASWAPAAALVDANTLTPTFVPPAQGEYVLTLTVSDQKGLTGTRSVTINALDHATLGSFKWGANFAGNGYQVLATFTKPLDKATAENVANYRTTPQSADLSTALPGEVVTKISMKPTSAKLSADGLEVTLLFTTGTLERNTRFDISVNDGILGADGVAVAEVAGLPAMANSADTKAPTVAARRWATGKQVADAEAEQETKIWTETGIREKVRYNYIVEIAFSEMMDPATAENPAAYRIQEGEDRYQPTTASLAADGRTLTLVFQDGPLSWNSKLDVGLDKTCDMNGLMLAVEAGKSVSPNTNDKTAPQIAAGALRFVEGITDGGYQIAIDFNEPMDSVSLRSAANYRLAGIAASAAEADADGRRVTVHFASGAFSTDSKLTIPGSVVKDINGVALPAQTNLAVLPSEEEIISPGVPTLTWRPGNGLMYRYEIRAEFQVAMDRATVENENNWRVIGTDVDPLDMEVVLSSQTTGDEIAGRTAILYFWVDSMNRADSIEVSLNNSIVDINSRPLEQVTLSVAASESDTTPPEIVTSSIPIPLPDGTVIPPNTPQVLWCDCTTTPIPGQHLYKVTVWFSEHLDGASATNIENYNIDGLSPTAAMLQGGTTVVLEFAEFDRPLSNTDKLELLALVRDVNGLANVLQAPLQIIRECDTVPPEVVSVTWVSNPDTYQVAVEFNEAMDRNSAEFVAAWTLQDVDGVAQIPTDAGLDLEDPTRLLLSFGAGAFSTDAQLMFSGDVRDISGNTLSGGAAGGWPRAVSPDPDDSAPPQIVSAQWGVDSFEGYVVLLRFSEPIDAANPGVYTLDSVSPESWAIDDGGCTATLVFPIASSPAAFGRSAKLGSSGIKDLSGDTATDDVRDILANPLDLMFPFVFFAEAEPSSPGTLQISVWYTEVLDATSAQRPSNYQISGTFIKPVAAVLDPADGMTVILTFDEFTLPAGLPPVFEIDVSLGDSVYDINGIPAPQQTGPVMPVLIP